MLFGDLICTAENKKRIEECYYRTYELLWHLIYSITKNEPDTYDVLQGAYERLIIQLPKIIHLSSSEMDSYLVKIAKNLAYRLHNNQKRVFPTDKLDSIQGYKNVESIVENKQLGYLNHRQLMNALSKIPIRYQQVIHMKFFLNYSNIKIAEQLHINVGSVRMLQTRALRLLRKQM